MVWERSEMWVMEFNIKKCSVIEFGKNGTRVKGHYKLGNDNLAKKTRKGSRGDYHRQFVTRKACE